MKEKNDLKKLMENYFQLKKLIGKINNYHSTYMKYEMHYGLTQKIYIHILKA